jgi:uncharacterized membrane protein YhhN
MSVTPTEYTETPEEIAYEARAHETALFTGGRMVIGIGAFFFGSLAFTYFYLRSSNGLGLWRPHGMTAPTAPGAWIFGVTLATVAVAFLGMARFRAGLRLDWEVAGWTTVLGGLVAAGLQAWELTRLPFYPGTSGYSSCFIAWAVMNIVLLLSGLYWLETLLARAIRLRRAIMEEGGTGAGVPAARIFRVSMEGCTYYWAFIAAVGLVFYLLFYVV